MLDPSFPQKLQELVKREIGLDERIVWSGMPVPTFFTKTAVGSVLFGIPWTAFSLFWMVAAGMGSISFKGGFSLFSLFPLFGVPFVIIGIGMLTAPLYEYFKSRNSIYVITNKRAISIVNGRTTVIRSYTPSQLTKLFRRQKGDGAGDVIIMTEESRDSDNDKHRQEHGFTNVSDAQEVEKYLKRLAATHVADNLPPSSPHLLTPSSSGSDRLYPDAM